VERASQGNLANHVEFLKAAASAQKPANAGMGR